MTTEVRWRVRLAAAPSRVYGFLATDVGRGRWWVERSVEHDGLVALRFADGSESIVPVLLRRPPHAFALRGPGGSEVHFALRDDGRGGTELALSEQEVPDGEWSGRRAAWLARLLLLKAACDHGVDLRGHDPARPWDDGWVDA